MAYTTINKSSDYFNTKLYTGDGTAIGSGGKSITVGFQPDFTWIKNRSNTTPIDHDIFDSIRGATKFLRPSQTNAESTLTEGLTSFDGNGFTVGSHPSVNGSGDAMVSWNWLASNTTASNTDGSITSNVSANTTSGFSIVSYTGSGTDSDTVGHGLGVAPKVIIVKDRSSGTNQWRVRHESLSSNYNLFLNGTDVAYNMATATNDGGIGDLDNANTFDFVAGLTNAGAVNTSGNNYIAYCFAEKKGFSKFGSYVGNNGGTDGVFVYTGFKPALVIQKLSSHSGGNWLIRDNKRNTFNTVNSQLEANTSDAEETNHAIDFLSNGFKTRANGLNQQDSGYTYIYMAFAEQPLVGTNNIPATAR